MGWGATLSDEDWIGLGGLKHDADYFDRVFMDTESICAKSEQPGTEGG